MNDFFILGVSTKPRSQIMYLPRYLIKSENWDPLTGGTLLGSYFTSLGHYCYFPLRKWRTVYTVSKSGTPKGGILFGRWYFIWGGRIIWEGLRCDGNY